jgi:hypothetical protein
MPGVAHVEVIAEPPCKIRIVQRGGKYLACATLEGPGGPVNVCASVSIAAAHRWVSALARERPDFVSGFAIPGFVKSIARGVVKQAKAAALAPAEGAKLALQAAKVAQKAAAKAVPGTPDFNVLVHSVAKKVARARVLRKVLSAVDEVSRDPMVAKAVGLTAIAYPPVGVPLAAVLAARKAYDSSRNLLRRVAAGDPKAILSVRELAASAAAGHPQAARAVQIMAIVQRYRQVSAAEMAVSGTDGLIVGAFPRHGRAHGTLGMPGGSDVHVDFSWQTAGMYAAGAV